MARPFVGSMLFVLASGMLTAHAASAPSPRPQVLERLLQCRQLPDLAARDNCYDAAAAALDQAQRNGDVVIADRVQIHEAKRQAFGLALPSLSFLDRGDRPDVVDHISLTLDHANLDVGGRWVITTREGQVWRQVDTQSVYPDPRPGDAVTIRAGMLGSYFVKSGKASAFRATRDR